MANPIQRLVQLVLDKNAANKTEAEAKKSLKGVEGGMDQLKKAALKLGAVIATAFGIRAMTNFLKSSVKVGMEAQAIWNRLGHAVEGAGVSYKAVEQDIHRVADAMQDATKIGDEQFASILTELITTTHDYEKSLAAVGLVADLAAAKQMDVKSAAQLMGKVMMGQTSMLTRYGIIIKEGEDAMEVLRKSFAGFAANEAKTFEGQLVQVNNAWDDFKQAIGEAMIAGAEGESVMASLTLTIKSLTDAVNVFSRAYSGMSETAFANQKAITRVVASAKTPEAALIGLETFKTIAEKELEDAKAALADMTTTWGTVKGIAKTGDMFAWNTEVESVRETVEGLQITLSSLGQTMADLKSGKTTTGVLNKAGAAAAKGVGDLSSRITGSALEQSGASTDLARGPKFKLDTDAAPGLSAFTSQMDELTRAQESAHTMAVLTGNDYENLDSQISMLTNSMQVLADQGVGPTDLRMQGLADRLREVQDESALVTRQHMIMTQVAYATGDILNAAFGAGIGQLAASKAKQNAIMAAEQAVQGLVASLNPFTAPLAGGHFAAAGQFAGIAAAWGTLAGATGGFSGGGGGGRAGGFSAGRDSAGNASQRAEVAGPELNVYFTGEGFDAVNPRVQRIVYAANQEAINRAGPNARVRTFRGAIPQAGGR